MIQAVYGILFHGVFALHYSGGVVWRVGVSAPDLEDSLDVDDIATLGGQLDNSGVPGSIVDVFQEFIQSFLVSLRLALDLSIAVSIGGGHVGGTA